MNTTNDNDSVATVPGVWRGLVARLHRKGLLDRSLKAQATANKEEWDYRPFREQVGPNLEAFVTLE